MSANSTITRALAALAISGFACFAVPSPSSAAPGSDKWVAPPNANAKANPLPASATSNGLGEKLYFRECLSCHGKKGAGDGPKAGELTVAPGNLTTSDFQNQSDGALFWKISNGRKPMPSFKTAFSEEERWQMVNYLRTLGGRSAISRSAR